MSVYGTDHHFQGQWLDIGWCHLIFLHLVSWSVCWLKDGNWCFVLVPCYVGFSWVDCMLNEGVPCILAKWFWPTEISLSFTYGSPETSCNKQAGTYLGRRSASLMKEFWTLCIFVMTVSETVMVETTHIRILTLYIVCRFVKWFRDLSPTFCWPIFLNDEIFGCSILKCPQNVLWKSSCCQMWYLRILFEDSTKGVRHIKIKQVLPLLQIGTWRILWLLFSLDLVLFSIWHTTLPVCLGPFANTLLLNQCFYSQPIGRCHLQIATCQSGGDWDLACHWHR